MVVVQAWREHATGSTTTSSLQGLFLSSVTYVYRFEIYHALNETPIRVFVYGLDVYCFPLLQVSEDLKKAESSILIHKSDRQRRESAPSGDNTRPTQAKAEARQLPCPLPGEDAHSCDGRARRPAWAVPGTLLGRTACMRSSAHGSAQTAPPHTPSPQAHTDTHSHKHTHGTADIESNVASSLKRRGCRRRRSRTGSRCRRNAGESRLPRSSPLLCACRQHAGNQHWSHRSPPGGAGAIACASCMVGHRPRTQGSGLTFAGGARYGGLGWAGQHTAKA